MLLFYLACACPPADTGATLDLTEALGPDEARAGVVTDEAALFGGSAAEGRAGDVKIYNDRVRFVVQATSPSHYYAGQTGMLVDADVVRPEGAPGRDLLDELGPMIGLGRLCDATEVAVLADGSDGEPAVVRVSGHGSPMTLLTGALENPDLVADLQFDVTTDYTLRPGSWLLELRTEVRWRDVETTLPVGDFAMIGLEVAEVYGPQQGLDRDEDTDGSWIGAVGRDNELALALMSDDVPFPPSALASVLQEVGPVLVGIQGTVTLADGDTLTLSRFLGAGPDLATLTGAWLEAHGEPTREVGGRVTAGGAGVPGARVHVVDAGGAPWTMAVTADDGTWAALVPEAGDWSAVATGRGEAVHYDLPPGAGWYGPYAAPEAQDAALASLAEGALPMPMAEGYGVSATVEATSDTALALTPPGTLRVGTTDARPAVVRVDFAAGDPVTRDRRVSPGRPGGAMAWGHTRDGSVEIPVEPGTYDIVVHRGLRWEPHEETVTVESGQDVAIMADLALAWSVPGVLAMDPHSHASTSGDGEITMAERLVAHASNGVEVHNGTDHDHVTDFRPLLAPLGLDTVITTVGSNEVSPVLRGHFNAWPWRADSQARNGGAVVWWETDTDTAGLFAAIREAMGDGVIQVNHPTSSSGMFALAGYDPAAGTVADPDRWTDDFDAVEVSNSGDWEQSFPYYLDLLSRGLEPTPTAVSDSHGWSGAGQDVTFLYAGVDDPTALTDDALVAAMRAHATVASTGPFVEATIDGEWAPGRTITGPATLEVAVLAPSWMGVDVVELLENGEVVDSVAVEGTGSPRAELSFALDPDEDAHFVVVARGDDPMAPVYPGRTAWAATAAVKVDPEGDGWTAPLPSLAMGEP